jgi:hypothetical protein
MTIAADAPLPSTIASSIVPLWLMVPNNAVAQTGIPKPVSTNLELPAAAPGSSSKLALTHPLLDVRAVADPPYLPQSAPARDSLKNGTIIGAVVGAVALGACRAESCATPCTNRESRVA